MNTPLLELLRDRALHGHRNDGFGIYACFFRVGQIEKLDRRLLLEKIHQDMPLHIFLFPYMQKLMLSEN